ncbi:MAG: rhomboid family intramembrane serine protease [Gemmatimonadales bacterium]
MGALPFPRISPWVARLIAVAAGVQLLLATVFTAPAFTTLLAFDPAHAFTRPWTFVSYLFVHGGLLHLLINAVVFLSFGPAVERRLGGGKFLAYFFYCGIGAAAFAVGLDRIYGVAPFVGMSGAIMGVALAYAMLFPAREVFLFPLPFPVSARTLILILAAFDLAGAIWWRDGIAHEAHLGGLLFGWLYFRMNALSQGRDGEAARSPIERVVLVAPGHHTGDAHRPARSSGSVPAPRSAEPDRRQVEVDRLLDKISAKGIGSLSPAERRFLDETAKRNKDLH